MKKNLLFKPLLIAILGLCVSGSLTAQVTITGVSDSVAVLNEAFTATVSTTGGTPTFSLLERPDGMNIGSSSGNISYTPTAIENGGRVIVQAQSGASTDIFEFNLYVSDAIECDPSLISYFNLNENGGTSFEDYASGYNATSATSVTGTTGKVDGAITMSPSSNSTAYLTIPDADQYEWTVDEDFSFSLWVYSDGPSGYGNQILITKWRAGVDFASSEFIMAGLYDNAGVLYPRWYLQTNGAGNPATSATPLPTGEWVHLAFVYDADNTGNAEGDMRCYMNGNLVINSAVGFFGGTDFEFDNVDLTIGHLIPYSNSDPFNGKMDEVLIYDKALTSGDVSGIIADGNAGTAHCKPGNTAPELTNSFPAVDQDDPYTVTLVAGDLDGDGVTIAEVSTPDWLTYASGSKVLSGTPGNDDVGDHTVTFTLNDGTVTVTRSYTVTVNNVNDLPEVTSTPPTTVDEDAEYTYTMEASDIDAGDEVTLTAELAPDWLTFNPSTGVLSGTPTNDDFTDGTAASEAFDVELRAYDNSGEFTPHTFSITVTNINDAPVVTGQNTISTDENTPVQITMAAAFTDGVNITDVDNDFADLSLSVQAGTDYTFTGNTITPADNFSGVLAVNVIVTDGNANVPVVLNVNVAFVNDIPAVTSTPVETVDDYEEYSYEITVEDGDPADVITMTATTLPTWLTFDQTSNTNATLSGVPGQDDVGSNDVVIEITDNNVASPVLHSFTITVTDINTAPSITSDPIISVDPNQVYAYSITVEDKDENDDIDFTATEKPGWLTLEKATSRTAVLHGTPTDADQGTHSVLIQVSDGQSIDQQSFTVTVGTDGISLTEMGSFSLYPVPAEEMVTFEYNNLNAEATLMIIDISGKQMDAFLLQAGEGKFEIDLSSYDSGMYLYQISSVENRVTGRLIVK